MNSTAAGRHVPKGPLVALLRDQGVRVRARLRPGPRAKIEPLTVAQLAARPKPPTPWKSPYTSWGRDEVAERLGPTLRRPRRLD